MDCQNDCLPFFRMKAGSHVQEWRTTAIPFSSLINGLNALMYIVYISTILLCSNIEELVPLKGSQEKQLSQTLHTLNVTGKKKKSK